MPVMLPTVKAPFFRRIFSLPLRRHIRRPDRGRLVSSEYVGEENLPSPQQINNKHRKINHPTYYYKDISISSPTFSGPSPLPIPSAAGWGRSTRSWRRGPSPWRMACWFSPCTETLGLANLIRVALKIC